jgi:site-specific DNA recombinase
VPIASAYVLALGSSRRRHAIGSFGCCALRRPRLDAGESARKADRPELMRMIQYVKRNRVAYCIVHKVDRLARNRADDVTIHLALQEAGVMLVSATENIDETPSGMLLHGIMSTIAEFYSRNLATEVIKGMTQKAAGGGTIGKAPIGYLSVRVRDEFGREVRTVELGPDRAPLIEWAFKAYASGDWTVSQLHDELTSRGLTSLPTPKHPSKPLAVSSVHRLLTNPYYKGDVIYRGVSYKGAHDPLVPAEVWYQVQSVLTAHKSAAEATQVHDHYLKGTVYCGQCGSRLIVSNAKNRHGNVYPYFVCSGRHSKRTDGTRQAILIEDVEHLIEDYYQRVQITPARREALAGMLHHEFDRLMSAEADELAQLTANRDRLEHEQDRLMQAHYADAIPLAVLQTRARADPRRARPGELAPGRPPRRVHRRPSPPGRRAEPVGELRQHLRPLRRRQPSPVQPGVVHEGLCR